MLMFPPLGPVPGPVSERAEATHVDAPRVTELRPTRARIGLTHRSERGETWGVGVRRKVAKEADVVGAGVGGAGMGTTRAPRKARRSAHCMNPGRSVRGLGLGIKKQTKDG